MQIFKTDNFDRGIYNEKVIATNIESEEVAKVMAEALNARWGGASSQHYFRVMPDEAVPFTFEP